MVKLIARARADFTLLGLAFFEVLLAELPDSAVTCSVAWLVTFSLLLLAALREPFLAAGAAAAALGSD